MENDTQLLKLDKYIKPNINVDSAKLFIGQLYGLIVLHIEELDGYYDSNFKVEVDSSLRNFLEARTCVFKVLNSMDSKENHVESENDAMFFLSGNNVNCPVPVKNKNGQYYSLEKIEYKKNDEILVNWHNMRLMVYLPGLTLNEVALSKNLLLQAGEFAGKISKVFSGWSHSNLDSYDTIWALENTQRIRNLLFAIDSVSKKQIIKSVIDEFENVVLIRLHDLPKSVIHGDISHTNMLVECGVGIDNNKTSKICGIIDFGIMNVSCSVHEIAVTIAYLMLQCKSMDFLDAGGYILAGYLKNRNLNKAEWAVLKTCVAVRLAQSLVMGAYIHSLQPSNDYSLLTASTGWSKLEIHQNESSENIVERWKNIVCNNCFHD